MSCAICNSKQRPQLSLLTPKPAVIKELKKRQIIHHDSKAKKICDRHYTEDLLKITSNGKKRLSNANLIPTENLAILKNEDDLKMPLLPRMIGASSTPKGVPNSITVNEVNLGTRHADGKSKKEKRAYKRKTIDKLADVTPQIFKSKPVVPNPFDELVHHLAKLQPEYRFPNFEIINGTIQCTFHPSSTVTACIKIRNANELWVRVTFKQSREIVEIEDKSFGNYSIEVKIQRLSNLYNKLRCLQNRKEELFPAVRNWKDYANSTNLLGSPKSSSAANSTPNQSAKDGTKHQKIDSASRSSEKIGNDAKIEIVNPDPYPLKPGTVKKDLESCGKANLGIDILHLIHQWLNTKPSDFVVSEFKDKLNAIIQI